VKFSRGMNETKLFKFKPKGNGHTKTREKVKDEEGDQPNRGGEKKGGGTTGKGTQRLGEKEKTGFASSYLNWNGSSWLGRRVREGERDEGVQDANNKGKLKVL